MQRFLDWAHTMGWRYKMMPYHLAHFQAFLERRGIQRLDHVEPALVVEYQQSLLATRCPSTVNGQLGTLRALWRYLQREELAVQDATRGVIPLGPHHFVPHLYSARELSLLERATRAEISRIRTPGLCFCRRTRHAAFGLLRDCGLRVSEACRLNLDDYQSQARTLRIERTKFFKTRHIPLPRTTCALLDQYLLHRLAMAARAGESPAFFVSLQGRRLGRGTLESTFQQLLIQLGLYRPRRMEGRTAFGSTNLHALRHSYAVRTLERWQSQKADVQHLLPLLSAYMGHAHVNYTAHYLHLTPLLRQLASQRFSDLALPRLDHQRSLTNEE
jgi:site-specific recombinase XerD